MNLQVMVTKPQIYRLVTVSVLLCSLVLLTRGVLSAEVQDGCATVLALTGRDERSEQARHAGAKHVYDHYCSGDKVKDGVNLSLGVSDLLESFDLGFGSTSERLSQVCKTYSEKGFSESLAWSRSSLVVRDAIRAWSQCKALAQKEINVIPHIGGDERSFNIDFVQETGRPVRVNGVFYDPAAAECFGRNQDIPNAPVGPGTEIAITNGDPWTVTCWRKGENVGGTTVFPAVEISIPTSGLTFRMTVPRSALPAFTWATDFEGELRLLKTTVGDLQRDFTGSVESLKLECTTVNNLGQVATCPAGYFVTGCSAGMNKGSISHTLNECRTHDTNVDWTEARCCRVAIARP